MRIETGLQIENSFGEIAALFIVAEYEPASSVVMEWGIPTEAESGEIIDIISVDGQKLEDVYKAEFFESHTLERFIFLIEEAVRDELEREFDCVAF